ncbi:hypothetical protein AAZX31_17G089200 [Glycine max]|nr:hypothetical protein GLYMA_17G091750v4 [Glycine max]KAH1117596.1 hypothetical protein GYH30_046733 [Glycine max]
MAEDHLLEEKKRVRNPLVPIVLDQKLMRTRVVVQGAHGWHCLLLWRKSSADELNFE